MNAEWIQPDVPEVAENENPTESETKADIKAAQEAARKRKKQLGRYVVKAGGMMLSTGTVVGGMTGYIIDVDITKISAANSVPYLIENSEVPILDAEPLPIPQGVYRAMDAADKTYINNSIKPVRLGFFNNPGLGMVDTYQADKTLSAFDKYGSNISVHSGNSGINISANVDRIEDYIEQENLNQAAFYGNSMGCLLVLKEAVELLKRDPEARVPLIILDSPAIDASVLRPRSLRDAYTAVNAMGIAGAEYSRVIRHVAELSVRKQQILDDPSSFGRINDQVFKNIYENPDFATNILVATQAQTIINARAWKDFDYLGSLPEDRKPFIAVMVPADPKMDDVVNARTATKLIKKWTKEANLPLLGPYKLENFHHGAQWMDKPEYKKVLGRIMQDFTAKQAERDEEQRIAELSIAD